MGNFSIDFVSQVGREHLMVEVYFRNQRLCQINREQGKNNLEIEFLTDLYKLEEPVNMTFSLAEFEDVILEAKTAIQKPK